MSSKRVGNIVGLCAVVVWLATAGSALAQVVLTVCPWGCDFTSIQAAIQAAPEGATIQVRAGTYQESLMITKPLNLVGEGADTTVIVGGVAILATRLVSLTGFTVSGQGVQIQDSQTVTLRDVAIVECQGDGLTMVNSGTVTVQRSRIRANQGAGVLVTLGSKAIVSANEIMGNGGDGISIGGSQVDLRSNLVQDNQGCGIRADEDSRLTGEVRLEEVMNNGQGNLCGAAIRLDKEPPAAPRYLRVSPEGWTNQPITVRWENPQDLTGVVAAWYKLGSPPASATDGTRIAADAPLQLRELPEGEVPFYLWLEDGAGNKSHENRAQGRLYVDRTKPVLEAGSPRGTAGNEGWYRSAVTVPFTARDDRSGFDPDGRLSLTFERSTQGEGTNLFVEARIQDRAGNAADPVRVGPFKVDQTPPRLTATRDPIPNAQDWNNTDVTVRFSCTDPVSGVASCTPAEPIQITKEGEHTLEGRGEDRAGNVATLRVVVRLDKTPPTGSLQINGGAATTALLRVTLGLSAQDNLSGPFQMRFSNDGQTWSDWEPFRPEREWDLSQYGGTIKLGPKTVYAQLQDQAGNISKPLSASIEVVAGPPLAPLNPRVSPAGWTNKNAFTVDWDQPPHTARIVAVWYKLDAPPERPDDGTRVAEKPLKLGLPAEGEHSLYLWLEDELGQKDPTRRVQVTLRLDQTPPQVACEVPDPERWYNHDVEVPCTASDAASGLASPGDAQFKLVARGEGPQVKTDTRTVRDVAGNERTVGPFTFKIDKTKPEGRIVLDPARPDGQNGWYVSPVKVHYECSDALSGIAPGGCPPDQTLTEDGTHTLSAIIRDQAGNETQVSQTVKLDRTPPTGSLTVNDGAESTMSTTVTLRLSAQDNLSGVAEMRFSNDGRTWSDWEPFRAERGWDLSGFGGSESMGPKTVYAQLRDRAGNVATFSATIRLAVITIGQIVGVGSVAFSPDGRLLASNWVEKIKLWDVATGREVRTLKGHTDSVNSVAFSPDGKLLASGSGDKTIKLWEVATGREVRTLAGHTDRVLSVAFSPDGKLLASGSWDKTIKLWEVATGREVRTLKGHTGWVESVAFSPDGKLLASGADWPDTTIKLWEVATGREVRTLRGDTDSVNSVAFSPDGRLLASASWLTIKLWEVATGREVRTLKGHTYHVNSVAFSPDGKLLASGSLDDTIKLWDVATGKEVRTLTGHWREVNSVAFSPDGRLLASGSDDETIKLWDLSAILGR